MIYSQFINKTTKYLKSVRILKNYISFDMVFPSTWMVLKNTPQNIEILQNEDNENIIITSFVAENKKENIDNIENVIDSLIKTNIEREEKERLFKTKVQELKNIFEKQNLENLKALKFDIEDIEELTSIIKNANEESVRDTKTTKNA
jgi:hypothetical protein